MAKHLVESVVLEPLSVACKQALHLGSLERSLESSTRKEARERGAGKKGEHATISYKPNENMADLSVGPSLVARKRG